MPWEQTGEGKEGYIRSGHGKKVAGMTCRTTDFGGKMPKGIQVVRCRMPGSDTWWTQSYLFPKSQWTLSEAKSWFSKHKKEELKAALERENELMASFINEVRMVFEGNKGE